MLAGTSNYDIDVGDRCWRQNVLVTDLRCFGQHTQKSRQHNVITNITVTVDAVSQL